LLSAPLLSRLFGSGRVPICRLGELTRHKALSKWVETLYRITAPGKLLFLSIRHRDSHRSHAPPLRPGISRLVGNGFLTSPASHDDQPKRCSHPVSPHLAPAHGRGIRGAGRDWAAAIGSRGVRMKAAHFKTPETTEEVSSHPGVKGHWRKKMASEHPLRQRKAGSGLEKRLANLWSRRKITKKAHAVRGRGIKWEIPV